LLGSNFILIPDIKDRVPKEDRVGRTIKKVLQQYAEKLLFLENNV
jgi:hypothetical protein